MNNFELHGKKPYRNRDSQTTFVWSKFLGNDCWVTKPEQLLRVLVWGLAIGQHPPGLDVVRLCVNFFYYPIVRRLASNAGQGAAHGLSDR